MEEQKLRLNAGRTHVLRHNYEPSEPLAQLIQDFTGPSLRPRFLLRSSKAVYVDSVAYNRGVYREEDEEVKETINEAKKHPLHIARAAFSLVQKPRNLDDDNKGAPITYRLSLLPLQSNTFDALNDSLNCYPDTQLAPAPSRHYLFLDLPPHTALSMRNREASEGEFRQTIAHNAHKRLFCATVRDVRAIEVPPAHLHPQIRQ